MCASNVNNLTLRDAVFEKTKGVHFVNVMLQIEGQFLHTGNHFAVVVLTTSSAKTQTTITLAEGSTAIFQGNTVTNTFKSILHVHASIIYMPQPSTCKIIHT